MLRIIVSSYSLLLSLGAFYLGSVMLFAKGVFGDFPPEWIGVMPFSSWDALGLFGMIVFGAGNALVAFYGFRKKSNKVFVSAIILGALCFLCAASPIILLGEGYLPLVQLFLVSAVQILLGVIGLIVGKSKKGSVLTSMT